MAFPEYRWRGHSYRIADDDLHNYPGAVPVEGVQAKSAQAPADKARKAPANKARGRAASKKAE